MATLLKRDSNTGVSLRILRNFKNTYFEEYLRTVASSVRVIFIRMISGGKCGVRKSFNISS